LKEEQLRMHTRLAVPNNATKAVAGPYPV